jgi:hypothetical protein
MSTPAPTHTTQGAFAKFFAEAKRPIAIEDNAKQLRETKKLFSKVHHVTSSGFAQVGLPLKLRALVCAVFAASGGETRFKASYATLVYLLFRRGDGRTFNAKKSEVRRLLKSLIAWQEAHITFCTVLPGGRSKGAEGYEYEDTEFEIACLDGLAAAYEQTKNHPNSERVGNAVNAALSEMMKLPPFNNRFDVKEPSLNDLQKRDEKTAITKALLAAEKAETMHSDPMAYVRQLTAKIIEQAEAKFGAPKPTPPDTEGRISPSEARRQLAAQGVCRIRHTSADASLTTATVSKSQTPCIDGVEAPNLEGRKPKIASKAEENTMLKTDTGGDDENPPPVSSALTESQAAQTVAAFESVGVKKFEVFQRDETTGERSIDVPYKSFSGARLRKELPSYLERNATREESFIIRPRGAVIQIDDLNALLRARLEPFAFLGVGTSPGSFQEWIALPDGTTEETRKRVRERIYRQLNLEVKEADSGASGAMRWPDSINRKPKYCVEGKEPPRVSLVHVNAGRRVSEAELERAGLLAPELPEAPPCPEETRVVSSSRLSPEKWPERSRYIKCKDDGDEDRSRTDYALMSACLRRGFHESEVVSHIIETSPRARRRGHKHTAGEVYKAARKIAASSSTLKP